MLGSRGDTAGNDDARSPTCRAQHRVEGTPLPVLLADGHDETLAARGGIRQRTRLTRRQDLRVGTQAVEAARTDSAPSSAPGAAAAAAPRICMPTWRAFARMPFQCYRYEAQDVLCQVDEIDMIPLQPDGGFRLREKLQRRLLWRDYSRRLAYLNPGLRPVTLQQDYDAFFAVCENWWDLLYVNAIKGWEDRCRTSVLWLDELFVQMIPRYRHWLPSLRRFDHLVVGHASSAKALGEWLERPCHYVSPGADVLRFHGHTRPADRPIDVISVGRRFEGIHRKLLDRAESERLFYVHDTLVGLSLEVADVKQHRNMLANMLKRSKFFVVGPGMMGADEACGEHVVGARFYEGTAAGAILVGQAPRCPGFDEGFDWPDAVIELQVDGSDAIEKLRALLEDPDRMAAISRRNAAQAAMRHDWLYRWQKIYAIAGLPETGRMKDRQETLARLAAGVS
jgi:hypothetical protein